MMQRWPNAGTTFTTGCQDHTGYRGVARGLMAAAAIALVAFGLRAGAAQETLVERTVAIVGGAVITLSDVRTALALTLVEAAGPDAERVATTRLVERWLVLHEVSRFAPPEPPQAAVDGRLAQIEARAGSAAALQAILERGGFTRGRLAAWVRDDLRIGAYLDQRFATAGVPGEAEVTDYARVHAGELAAASVAVEDRVRAARERLQADRRRELIADWLAELRLRTPVVEIKN